MRLTSTDRRHAARIAVDRSCRLRRQGGPATGGRFEHARTINVSTSGALIEIGSAAPIAPGESLALAVAWDGMPVIRSDAFVQARVVRADRAENGAQRVAVRFAATEPVAMAA
jgi:hypothetical protein